MACKRRAPKTPTKQANPEFMYAMQGLRRSNATVPVPSGRRYKRKPKHPKSANNE